MTWSYSGNPSSTPKDEVRFLVGDTDSTKPQVQDEEINYFLTIHAQTAGTITYQAAADVAEGLAAKYAREVDRTIGSLNRTASQLYDHYKDLADRLRLLAATGGTRVIAAAPVLGGGGRTFLQGDWS